MTTQPPTQSLPDQFAALTANPALLQQNPEDAAQLLSLVVTRLENLEKQVGELRDQKTQLSTAYEIEKLKSESLVQTNKKLQERITELEDELKKKGASFSETVVDFFEHFGIDPQTGKRTDFVGTLGLREPFWKGYRKIRSYVTDFFYPPSSSS